MLVIRFVLVFFWGIKLSMPQRIHSVVRAEVLEFLYLKKSERRTSTSKIWDCLCQLWCTKKSSYDTAPRRIAIQLYPWPVNGLNSPGQVTLRRPSSVFSGAGGSIDKSLKHLFLPTFFLLFPFPRKLEEIRCYIVYIEIGCRLKFNDFLR